MESILPTLRTRLIKHSLHRGVTVVELLVVLGIIGILTTVIVTSHATFNKTILLTYTAYDVALTIRSAETFGLGTKVNSSIPGGTRIGYGMRFTPAGASSFTLFADSNSPGSEDDRGNVCHPLRADADGSEPDAIYGDCSYQDSEIVQSYELGNGMRVSRLFSYQGGGEEGEEIDALDIVFARPDPQAFFSKDVGSIGGGYSAAIAAVCVELTSPHGGHSHTIVTRTGQIQVSSDVCPNSI